MSTCATRPISPTSISAPRSARPWRPAATGWSTTRATRAFRAAGQRAAGRQILADGGRCFGWQSGFGGTLLGSAAGGAAGYGLGAGRARRQRHGGRHRRRAAGAAVATVADAYVQDTTYTIVTDVQIAEKAPGGTVISQSQTGQPAPGHVRHDHPEQQQHDRRPSATGPGSSARPTRSTWIGSRRRRTWSVA